MAVGTALVSALVVSFALAADNRFSVKAPNDIAFSEFEGYEAWQMIAPSQPDNSGGCGSTPAPGCIKTILGNPSMIKAYADGIPANGKPVPDGAVMTKIEWSKNHSTNPPYAATLPGTLSAVSFMVKDSKRFPDTNGWGYATFVYDKAAGTWKASSDKPAFAKTCHACHTLVKARDFVFTDYAQR
jgi:hypothetical protein